MNSQIKSTNERKHYIDWLRVLAFGLLFLFHSWRPFDQFPWHIKNEDQNFIFDLLTMFTHGWRMFLIFLVSGAGTWFALRSRKKAFVMDRVKRLIVPFIFGIVLIIPPQRFYEWVMFRDFSGNYLDFLIAYPSQQLGANMGSSLLLWFGHLGTHLWFLPFLFVMTMCVIPLFKKIQKGQLKFSWLKRIMQSNYGVFILVLPMILIRVILKPMYSEYTDWADFLIYMLPFIYGFLFMSDPEFINIIKKKTYLFLVVGLISSIYFIYSAFLDPLNIQEYMNPSYSLKHIELSVVSMLIAYSWILFFLGFFAKHMNFKHSILVPANISILPIYVLHQSLIIVFGYYIVGLELGTFTKFIIIACTAIPASILLYKLIQTNNSLRFLFGMKKKTNKKGSQVKQVSNAMAFDK
ncbi:MAG: acyltransferase family protein [Psychroserpens sp.]|uniref:acyltransferase family protein n=1 Tax=Psychroserpens sp. TaxID=2020870 RepID=UPI0030021A17